ncbi:MAG: hypothetical protein M3Y91_10805, partial [Actinomycetota bacterium]|nr:hypothetical protein [Actinomycetota bacterium]
MAERGPRPAFDTPASGSSPVPAQYGSLGGGLPRDRVDRPQRVARERKPFRWKVWREEPTDGDQLTDDPPPSARGDRPVATSRNRAATARTGGGAGGADNGAEAGAAESGA